MLGPEQEMAQFQASVEAEGRGPCVFHVFSPLYNYVDPVSETAELIH